MTLIYALGCNQHSVLLFRKLPCFSSFLHCLLLGLINLITFFRNVLEVLVLLLCILPLDLFHADKHVILLKLQFN